MDWDSITFFLTYIVYILLTQRIVRSAFMARRYKQPTDIQIALIISAMCWCYFLFIYSILILGYFSGWDLFITETNFREYTRVLGLPLLVSTSYIIIKVFP